MVAFYQQLSSEILQNDTDPPLSLGISSASPQKECEIVLQNPGRYADVAARSLRPWLRSLVAELAPTAGSFTVRFTSDREMRRLNGTYRQKDQATDVLSFPGDWITSAASSRGRKDDPGTGAASEVDLESGLHLGDVAISVPTARRQAATSGHPVARELRLLLLHGALHCLGHDHETDGGTMARLEKRLRDRWLDHG